MSANIEATLAERGARYGKFTGHAQVTQDLKKVIGVALAERSKQLAPDQMEALDMICHKIGRIVNGDANYIDGWRDVVGYAQLVATRLEETDDATDANVEYVRRVGGEWVRADS